MQHLCDAGYARVACLLDINLFPLKLLTWPCGTCEPMDVERANPGWAHTSLHESKTCFARGVFIHDNQVLHCFVPDIF